MITYISILISIILHLIIFSYSPIGRLIEAPIEIRLIEPLEPLVGSLAKPGRKGTTKALKPLKLPLNDLQTATYNNIEELNKALEEYSKTDLLTKKDFIYSNYFERLKAQAEPGWINSIRTLHKKSKIKVTTYTVVLVIIDKEGVVKEVLLLLGSGREDVDTLALAALRGKRFPNPPEALFDSDGFARLNITLLINK